MVENRKDPDELNFDDTVEPLILAWPNKTEDELREYLPDIFTMIVMGTKPNHRQQATIDLGKTMATVWYNFQGLDVDVSVHAP